MAKHRKPVLENVVPDSGVFPALVGTQITAAATPSVGDVMAYWMADGGSDEGLKFSFTIPQNYVGTPKLVVSGVLDGAPGASDTLGFGFRKRANAKNESADGTFDAEEVVSETIGSGGTNYSDEDEFELLITLTGGDYAVGDKVYGYVYIDASGTSYAGNVGITAVELEYLDA